MRMIYFSELPSDNSREIILETPDKSAEKGILCKLYGVAMNNNNNNNSNNNNNNNNNNDNNNNNNKLITR